MVPLDSIGTLLMDKIDCETLFAGYYVESSISAMQYIILNVFRSVLESLGLRLHRQQLPLWEPLQALRPRSRGLFPLVRTYPKYIFSLTLTRLHQVNRFTRSRTEITVKRLSARTERFH